MEMLTNTGWTDEARAASLAVRQEKAELRRQARWSTERREAEFKRQQEICRKSGTKFQGNWYPRGLDGLDRDPHHGKTGPEAPYGYEDTTGKPRKEPLYDEYGNPIIPRIKRAWQETAGDGGPTLFPKLRDKWIAEEAAWKAKSKEARDEWGRFGEKKRWLDENPDKTEADWKEMDRAQQRERSRRREIAKKMQEAEDNFFDENPDATEKDWEAWKRTHRVIPEKAAAK